MSWHQYPIHIVDGPNGCIAVIPNSLEIDDLNLRLTRLEAEIASIPAPPPSVGGEDVVDPGASIRRSLLNDVGMVKARLELCEKMSAQHENARRIDFEVRCPPFGSYLEAETESRTFVNGVPVIDDQKLMLKILARSVRLDGKDLSEDDVRNLDVQVALVLHSHVRSMLFVDDSLVPFWRRSQPS